MFVNQSRLILNNPRQLYYGAAVTDIDQDGAFEVIVAGFGFPNLVLKWNGSGFEDVAVPALMDATRQSISISAADIDGDGMEELYILNTDSFGGLKRRGDRLLDADLSGDWADLFSYPSSRGVLNLVAGRSVACVDRLGTGLYGFFVASYGGPMRFYELDEDGLLQDLAPRLRLDYVTGGRSVLAMPLVSEYMDIFVGNEQGANFLFANQGDGTFRELAAAVGLGDSQQAARGIAAVDSGSGLGFDLVCGNWEGPNRLFCQIAPGQFQDQMPPEAARPSRNRNIIVADFDNDGYQEIFFNNMGEPNRLYSVQQRRWVDIGDALEPLGLGTGAAVGDFDGDGCLELLVAHGEAAMQALSLYHTPRNGHHWLRVKPLTPYGAPARGAVVSLEAGGRTQRRVIDSGSGYLCQMEPVAHFGLGALRQVEQLTVRWLDGRSVTLDAPGINQHLTIPHPAALKVNHTV